LFAAWGRFVYRHRWPVLALSIAMLVASGFIASQGGKLESGGFIETAESGRASRLIEQELPIVGGSTFTLIFSSNSLSAKDPDFRAAVEAALVSLRTDPRIDSIITPYDASVIDPTRMTSKDGHAIAVDVAVKDTIDVARDYYPTLRAKVSSDKLAVQATGILAINNGFNTVLFADLQRAEVVALPLALILLLVVFGAVVAALIPLGTGLLAVMSGIAGMFLLSHITDVSVYAQNVVTLIGLGVAIDYSLFVTSRFREELRRGRDREDALAGRDGHLRTRGDVLRHHGGDRSVRDALLRGHVPAVDGPGGRDCRRERGLLRPHVPARAPRTARTARRPLRPPDLPAGSDRPRLVAHHRDRGHAPSRPRARSDGRVHPSRRLAVPSPPTGVERRADPSDT
jgi:predicted RND superfamily exporter protein